MEEIITTSQSSDILIERAATKIAAELTTKLKQEITTAEVHKELFGIKFGIMSDNISLNIEVRISLEKNSINILHQEVAVKEPIKTFKNNPAGNRIRRPIVEVEEKK